jgi:ABC-2 type transport system permease protein
MSAVALVTAERIKLLSVRSPWWCAGVAVAGVIGLSALLALTSPVEEAAGASGAGGNPFLQFALVVVLVMAAVAVTTEYRFSTIRRTFEAAPNRTAVMLAKAAVVAVAGALVGLLASFGSWATVWLLRPEAGFALRTAEDWRLVAVPGAVFAVGAVLALAVGILVRQTAAAVSIVLVWTLLVEQLVQIIPNVGEDIHRWMPFVNAGNAASSGDPEMPFGPWGSLGWFAAVAAAVFVAALVVVNRRDA